MAKARKIIAYNPVTDTSIMFPTVKEVINFFGISSQTARQILLRGMLVPWLQENNNRNLEDMEQVMNKMQGFELYYLEDFIEEWH